MMIQKIRNFFHIIVYIALILHVSICSEFFYGTDFWNILTLLIEVAFVFVVIEFFYEKCKMTILGKLSLFYFLLVGIMSLLNDIGISQLISFLGRSIEIGLLLMLLNINKMRLKSYILATLFAISLCVYVNYYYLLLFPDGIPDNEGGVFYFLGTNYNQIGIKIIIAFVFSVVFLNFDKRLFYNVILLVVIGIHSLLIVGSMTSLVCFVFLVGVLFFTRMHFFYLPLIRLSVLLILSFQLFVVFWGSSLDDSYILAFLDVLGKDNTFTGRTILWKASSDLFWESPIAGHGYLTTTDYALTTAFYGVGISPHNYIYSILHKGGFLLLVLLIIMIRISYKRIKPFIKNKTAFIIVMVNISMFIMMLFEVYESLFVYYLLTLMYYFPFINYTRNDYSRKY